MKKAVAKIMLVLILAASIYSCSVSYIKIKNSKDIKVSSKLAEPNDSIVGEVVDGVADIVDDSVEMTGVGIIKKAIKQKRDSIKKKPL